jgi:rare lipoprotein A
LSQAVASGNGLETQASYVQVGAFADRDAAEMVKRDLRALGFSDVLVTTLVRNPESSLHRVRIGPLEDASAVQDVKERLHRAALEDYRVVVDPAR